MTDAPATCANGHTALRLASGRCSECNRIQCAERYKRNSIKFKERSRQWRLANPAKYQASNRAYYAKNTEKIKAAVKDWSEQNKELVLARVKDWAKSNPERRREIGNRWADVHREQVRESNRIARAADPAKELAKCRKRQTAQMQRTPPWADLGLMCDIYRLARIYTDATGLKHHVDHIFPLRGRLVSGLHVPANLQVLPATENLKKGRRMPE